MYYVVNFSGESVRRDRRWLFVIGYDGIEDGVFVVRFFSECRSFVIWFNMFRLRLLRKKVLEDDGVFSCSLIECVYVCMINWWKKLRVLLFYNYLDFDDVFIKYFSYESIECNGVILNVLLKSWVFDGVVFFFFEYLYSWVFGILSIVEWSFIWILSDGGDNLSLIKNKWFVNKVKVRFGLLIKKFWF